MKKKLALCFILGCMTSAVLGGCGTKATAAPDASNETSISETLEESTSKEATEAELPPDTENQPDSEAIENADVNPMEDTTAKETDSDVTSSETSDNNTSASPVFGQKNIENYDGFKYLDCVLLTFSSSEDRLPIYMPACNYLDPEEESEYIFSDAHGIDLTVISEPTIRFDQDEYSLEENLAYALQDTEFNADLHPDYLNIVVHDVKKLDNKTAYATGECCMSYEYDDVEHYYAIYETLILKELDNGTTVMVTVAVDSYDVTEETDALIEELESFYQFEINWDADEAAKKIAVLSK